MKRILFVIVLAALVGISACKKENQLCNVVATVQYTGPIAGDGCDWVIVSGTTKFHPRALDSVYMVDSLRINLAFTQSPDTFICGWGVKMPIIDITCIEAAE